MIWMLGRRRREQTLNRETGRHIPEPPAALEAVERRVRAIADHEAMRWVDLGLRYLGQLIEVLDDPPAVVLVRAGSVGLEVMVDPPTPEAPGHFRAGDGGITWGLDPAIDLAELERLAGDRWPPYRRWSPSGRRRRERCWPTWSTPAPWPSRETRNASEVCCCKSWWS